MKVSMVRAWFSALISLVALAPVWVGSQTAVAAEPCDPIQYIKDYNIGLEALKRRDHTGALKRWRPLAEIGFAPAQSQFGRMYAAGTGVTVDAIRSTVLLTLAARQMEARAGETLERIKSSMNPQQLSEAATLVRDWRPRPDSCLQASLDARQESPRAGGKKGMTYRSLSIISKGPHVEAVKHIIDAAIEASPQNLIYFQLLDSIQVREKIKGIKRIRRDGRMFLALSDKYAAYAKPGKVAAALLRNALLILYRRLDGVDFDDPLLRQYKGITLKGSPHVDVNNKHFFDMVTQALDLSEKMSADIRRYVQLITIIVYDPPSRFNKRRGGINAAYFPGTDPEVRRLVKVTKNLKLTGAPAILVRSLVHEGTHAHQHLDAVRKIPALEKVRKRLRVLEKSKAGLCDDCPRLKRDIRQMEEDIAVWGKGRKFHGEEFVQEFECEAAYNGLIAVEQLGLGRSAGGPYASVCKNVENRRWTLPEDRQKPRSRFK